MFISKFKQWLDTNDPYGLQRIALPKALFIATVGAYVYWLFQPTSIQSFFACFFIVARYETPVIDSFLEKEQLLIFMTTAIILISVSFYLVYPFKGVFFFFSIFVLALTYFFVLKHFYMLKNLTMLLFVNGVIVLSTEPLGSIQVAYTFISSVLTAMIMVFICFKIYPNHYLYVWNKAVQKFIDCLENDIECAIKQKRQSAAEEIQHLGMARNFRRLLPLIYRRQAYRITVNLRNIEHCLDSIYYEEKNEAFWYAVKKNLELIKLNMKTYTLCGLPKMPLDPETQLQRYVMRCLQQVFIHWDRLCYLQKN